MEVKEKVQTIKIRMNATFECVEDLKDLGYSYKDFNY